MSVERVEQFLNSRQEAFAVLEETGLRDLARETARILITRANLTEEELEMLQIPQIIFLEGIGAGYVPIINKMFLDPAFLKGYQYKEHVFGEEIGHWLFFQVNHELRGIFLNSMPVYLALGRSVFFGEQPVPDFVPDPRDLSPEDIRNAEVANVASQNCSETAGRFSGMLVSRELGVQYMSFEEHFRKPERELEGEQAQLDEAMRLRHLGGYALAEMLMQFEGPEVYKRLIRWTVEDFKSAQDRYIGPLLRQIQGGSEEK